MKVRIISTAVAASLFALAGQSFAGGKEVYDTACAACHSTGAAGAPKIGDKAAWAPRVKDMNALHASALKGKGVMPAKGGNSGLSDGDVTAASDYMVSLSK